MLGLLNPGCVDLRYRSLYSRCCEFLPWSTAFPLSFFTASRSVFLSAIACDAGSWTWPACRINSAADLGPVAVWIRLGS